MLLLAPKQSLAEYEEYTNPATATFYFGCSPAAGDVCQFNGRKRRSAPAKNENLPPECFALFVHGKERGEITDSLQPELIAIFFLPAQVSEQSITGATKSFFHIHTL